MSLSHLGLTESAYIAEATNLITRLQPVKSSLVPVMDNLIDIVRGTDRPERPATQVLPLDIKYSGLSLLLLSAPEMFRRPFAYSFSYDIQFRQVICRQAQGPERATGDIELKCYGREHA